jgi:hypothetical protein
LFKVLTLERLSFKQLINSPIKQTFDTASFLLLRTNEPEKSVAER